MPQRKAALVGTAIGPSVATYNRPRPHLVVSCVGEIKLRITQSHEGSEQSLVHSVRNADRLALSEAAWTQIEVLEGDAEKVLCTIESRRS